jgi:hypothetical protein
MIGARMPFYLIDTYLAQPPAPTNVDWGGMGASVLEQPYPARAVAKQALCEGLTTIPSNRGYPR